MAEFTPELSMPAAGTPPRIAARLVLAQGKYLAGQRAFTPALQDIFFQLMEAIINAPPPLLASGGPVVPEEELT